MNAVADRVDHAGAVHLTKQRLALAFESVGKVCLVHRSRRLRFFADDVEEFGVQVGVMLFEKLAVLLEFVLDPAADAGDRLVAPVGLDVGIGEDLPLPVRE